jgi:hypothetical protein
MVTLLRLSGVPARIAGGLYHGERVEGEAGAFVFKSKHAHAWVEVPFLRDAGWVAFDPSPAAGMPDNSDAAGDLAAGAGAGTPPTPEDWLPASLFGWIDRLPLLLGWGLAVLTSTWWGLAVAAGAMLWFLWQLSHWFLFGPAQRHAVHRPPAELREVVRLFHRLLLALARNGHMRRRGETARALLQRASAALPEDRGERLAVALASYETVRFGGKPPRELDYQALRDGIAAV